MTYNDEEGFQDSKATAGELPLARAGDEFDLSKIIKDANIIAGNSLFSACTSINCICVY